MKFLFWLSLVGIFYAYVGYPLHMWALASLRPRPWLAKPVSPSVSIVLAVRDGVTLLQRKLDHLLASDYPEVREVIIVSDGSTDGTVELLAARRHPRLKSIILAEHVGKGAALNAGMAQATGEVILFVDIRPEIAAGAIEQLVSNFADPGVGCVTGELFVGAGKGKGASAEFGGTYWRYEKWIRTCESRYSSPVGVYGGFYAIRRALAVPQPPGIILDDMFEPLSILRQGYRVVVDSRAYVFDTWPDTVRGEFARKTRTLAGNFQLFRLAPWILTPRNPVLFQLIFHKVIRLLVPYLLLTMFASTVSLLAVSHVYAALAVLETLAFALAISGLCYGIPIIDRIAAPMSAILVLNVAAVVGLYKFLFTRGPLWKIWTVTNRPGNPQTENSLSSAVGRSTAVSDLNVSFGNNAPN